MISCSGLKTSLTIECVMHQPIPAAPPHPPGYCRAFVCLFSPGGGAFANFALPRGRASANPGAIIPVAIPRGTAGID